MPRRKRRPVGNPFGYDKLCMVRSLNLAAYLRRANQGTPRRDAGFRLVFVPPQDVEDDNE